MTDVAEAFANSDFAPQREDLVFPLPPTFDNLDDERQHRKQKLAGALRLFGKLGFAEGVAGHITVRDPEETDHFWVNPFGVNFKHMKVSDLILVNHEGEVVHGNRPVNKAAFAIHGAIHQARPDVMAAAHSHSIFGKAFSALGRPLRMITQDAAMFYNDWVIHTDSGGAIVNDIADGMKMTDTLGDKKALIHRNHGLITVADTVDAAAWWFIALERACQVQLVAEAAGEPHEIPHEASQYSYDQSGNPAAGWFQFQPLWDEISREQPDLFD
ncbi:MAG: class II aldolase/adducin family protein [Acidimicrobiales bacterium]|nr:class II aldolase/adducin family protein [Acidimicrobiales bacterium]